MYYVVKAGGEEEMEGIDKALASPFFKKQMKRPCVKSGQNIIVSLKVL